MEEMINVQKLSQSFNLSPRQEGLVKVLLDSDNKELEETKYRDKYKVLIKPDKGLDFQKELKTLEKKNVVLIGYDEKGRRIVKMSPIKALNEKINTTVPSEAVPIVLPEENNKRQIIGRVTKDTIQQIKETIKYMLSSSPEKWMFSNDVYAAIKLTEPSMAKMTYKHIIDSLVAEKAIEYKGFSRTDNIKTTKKFIKLVDNIVEPKHTEITIKINENDYIALEKSLEEFHITSDPKKWLSDLVDDNIIYLLNNKSLVATVLLNKDLWYEHQFLKEHFKDHGSDFDKVISNIVCDFIGKEYNTKYFMNEFVNAIEHLNDKKSLETFRSLIEQKINSTEPPPHK
jgi:hypothetical protein